MPKLKSVFKRYEKKYMLKYSQYEALNRFISDFTVPDRYGLSTICNIYYDTSDYRLIRASIEKPVYKEKLRLRSYSAVNDSDSLVFTELKKKYKSEVFKRRESMTLEVAERYLAGEHSLPQETQIIREINWFTDFYGSLSPAMFIGYEREAFFGADDPDFRITFDRNILCRNDRLSLREGFFGSPLINQDEVLMEIKILGAMPLELSKELDRLGVFPTSFSKYGTAYTNLLTNKTISEVFNCA